MALPSKLSVLRDLAGHLIRPEDRESLSLASVPDIHASCCRAWLLAASPGHPEHDSACALIDSHGPTPTSEFLNVALPGASLEALEGENLWSLFCPTAEAASRDPANMATTLRERRRLSAVSPAARPFTDPSTELLLTTNALVSPPLDPESPFLPSHLRDEARRILATPQRFWYDHPVPLDASPEENEILYGIARLDEALAFECDRGHLAPGTRIDLAISVSVTHEGMEQLAAAYVRDLVRAHLTLSHLRVFIFDETRCRKMIDTLCPGDEAAADVFGVNGAYGRHYSFLKALLLFWQQAVNPKAAFTFKIDLDQVFDQKALLAHTGHTALQLLMNPNWGGHARDHAGRKVDLGMLAGGLVNERDAEAGLFVPDVRRPHTGHATKAFSSVRIFCPQWPQAVSTEAEIMQADAGFQRIHVTGGTTGITADALRRWRPFTPCFINRAEDQAYALSAINDTSYLSHLHANGLIMRHDKAAFAGRSITHARAGKAIGNIERLMLFSRYAALLPPGFQRLRDHCWPFTSCFMHPQAKALAALIFLIDGSSEGGRFVAEGAPRLLECLDFCETGMDKRLEWERRGWDAIYESLSAKRYSMTDMSRIIAGAATDYAT
ncbi:MAG: hypothetical protein ACON31_03870 [Candidatus Puniceispirillaceae bacterium]